MKKVVSMLLVAVMLLSCLAGCGQKGEQQQSSQSTSQAEKESESKSEEASTSLEEPVEPTTVTWVLRGDAQEDDEKVVEAVNELLRERYNLELNVIWVSAGEYNDRCRMMITGGEEFDLMYTANWTNNFYDNVNQEAFLSLNDLLESEVGQELLAVYPQGHYEVARVGGEVYAIPNYQMCYTQNAYYIQKDLADKYNLGLETGDKIENIYEIMDWLTAVRDNEEGIYPLRKGGSFTAFVHDYDYETVSGPNEWTEISVDNLTWEVKKAMDNPDWLERRKRLNQLYKDGYFRSDVATVTDDSADFKSNNYAVHATTGKPGGEVSVSANQGEEYLMILVDQEITKASTAGSDTMTAINVNSKNPEAAFKLYTVFWTDKEVFNTFLFGIEGEHYTKVNENRVELIADSGYNRSTMGWMVGSQFNQWLVPGQDDNIWTETEAINNSATPSVLTGFVLDSNPISTELAQLSSVKGEYDAQYVYVDDVDAWYQEYYNKCKAAGIDTVVAEVQRQLDEWRAANGK